MVTRISPFAAQLVTQRMNCGGIDKIRFILNDAIVPSTGLNGCKPDPQGFCDADTVIAALQQRVDEIDWDWSVRAVKSLIFVSMILTYSYPASVMETIPPISTRRTELPLQCQIDTIKMIPQFIEVHSIYIAEIYFSSYHA
jgi:hypothetical protein